MKFGQDPLGMGKYVKFWRRFLTVHRKEREDPSPIDHRQICKQLSIKSLKQPNNPLCIRSLPDSMKDSPEKFLRNDRGTQVTFYFSSFSAEKEVSFPKNPNNLFRRLFTVCLSLTWISRNSLDMLFIRMKENHFIFRFKASSAKSLGFPKILKRRLNLSCKMMNNGRTYLKNFAVFKS